MLKELMKAFLWGSLLQPFCQLTYAQDITPIDGVIGDTLTLQQAINLGIRNNVVVGQAELQTQIDRINLQQARANLLPILHGTANQTIGFGRTLNTYDYTYTNQVNSGNYGINGYLNLFNGLQAQNNIRQCKYAYAAGKMDLQQQIDHLTLNILLAYLQVISSRELVTIAREQAGIDSIQLNRLKVLNEEGGLLLLSNLSDLKGKYADDKANIANAVNNFESSRINLLELLNVPYKRNIVFRYDITVVPPFDNTTNTDTIYQFALHVNPAVQAATLKVQAYEKALSAAKGQYYPSLSLSGSIATNYYSLAYNQVATTLSPGQPTPYYFFQEGRQINILTTKQNYDNQKLSFGSQFGANRAASVGIQLTIPLFNSFRTRNNVKQARINLANAQLNKRAAQIDLQQQIEQAFQHSVAAYQQYKSYAEEAAAYGESFRITQIRFNEGIVNSDTYVIAKNNLDRSNVNLIIARYNYIFRIKVIDYYRGQLQL